MLDQHRRTRRGVLGGKLEYSVGANDRPFPVSRHASIDQRVRVDGHIERSPPSMGYERIERLLGPVAVLNSSAAVRSHTT